MHIDVDAISRISKLYKRIKNKFQIADLVFCEWLIECFSKSNPGYE